MEQFKVLLVDDEEKFLDLLKERLKRKGHYVDAINCSVDALKSIEENSYDVALFDIMMNKMSGLELLEKSKKVQPDLEVVMLTGYGTIETSIEAMKKGAYDYLLKPINPTELELVLQRAAEKKKLKTDNKNLAESIKRVKGSMEMIGQSEKMIDLKNLIERVADSPLPVLILGESGTGKELVADALHYQSSRGNKTFIPINSSTIPNDLLESELFGHVQGAFTGAHSAKKGLVELADGGTLFLDEIGDMDPTLQVKLLRFLDTGEFRPVGGTTNKRTKVRIVAATNRNLIQGIEEGKFREDLYYRLSVVTVAVPPLRERSQDILLLADYFLNKKTRTQKKLSEDSKIALQEYKFPGNVRELANLIERGALLAKGQEIEPDDLFITTFSSSKQQSENLALSDVEKNHINHVLKLTQWSKPNAAKILGIGLRTLYRKIEEYNLHHK